MYSAVPVSINLPNLIILAERFYTIKVDAKIHTEHTAMIIPIFILGNMFSPSIKRKPDTGCLYGMFGIGVQHG